MLSLADGREADSENTPLDLTVRGTFSDGSAIESRLSESGTLWPPPPVKRYKFGPLEQLIIGDTVLTQQFRLPLTDSAQSLRSIELVFDVSPEGAIYVDEVGTALVGRS